MSMTTVAAAIKVALSNDNPGPYGETAGHIDGQEGINILKAAKFGKDGKRATPVTAGEIGKIVDLFDRRPKVRTGDMMTLAIPENPGQVTFDRVASSAFKAFLANHGVQHPVVLKDQVMDAKGDYGEPLASPPDVAGLTHIFLKDNRPACGTREDAFVDTQAGTFYLKSTGGHMAPGAPQTSWYGPIELAPVEKQAGVAMREKLMAMKDQISESEWNSGAQDLPMGPQFEAVRLGGTGFACGFNYTAYLPVGVAYPGAPQSDPNDASYAFIMRSGGFAGMTNVVRVDLTEQPAQEQTAQQAVPAA